MWYAMSATFVTTMVKSVPEISDAIVEGAEEIVGEVVHGSRSVIRCVSLGALVMAAMVVVR